MDSIAAAYQLTSRSSLLAAAEAAILAARASLYLVAFRRAVSEELEAELLW
ncbi:MAG: hypothetical protein QXU97_04420 [Fervidicoccaceae archaeon]